MTNERSWREVPAAALALLVASLLMQFAWHASQPRPQAAAATLTVPPSVNMLNVASLGEPITLARLLMLWLQAFDNQPGISIPFRELDYGLVTQWLEHILRLDPRGQYPLLAAARLYGEVPVPGKQRQMLEFVYEQFLLDPDRRWPWLAHAVFVAKHLIKDQPLALKYAEALANDAPAAPDWARQMRIFVLEDMGELEDAKILLGGLLDSGQIKDPAEVKFLSQRLKELKQRTESSPQH
ncbi:MAG TPA: hypothetical protein VMH34_08080 [Gammaproteobacteria bacterium]|nr:hypothetical protein [Gammaproteobacteria bacterium]